MGVIDDTGKITAERAPITAEFARFIAEFRRETLPGAVLSYARRVVFDAVATLAAATHPSVGAAAILSRFAVANGGGGKCSLFGQERRTDPVTAVLFNGTLGYAADYEPHHPEAILHPVAVMLPVALALAEDREITGSDAMAAVVLGCEVTYRVSMALGPRALYDRGFHPSAVAGCFGAAAASAYLLRLDKEACQRALGLAALQASGLMAWQDDATENARPFQMGMAARNGLTAALLAGAGFGSPDRVFDAGHTVFGAFSTDPRPERLLQGLGDSWDGFTGLAIKPYASVSFLHPALDALEYLVDTHGPRAEDVVSIDLRFANGGAHCIDDNPLKSHSAQYILPVRLVTGRNSYLDLFDDMRRRDPEIARLSRSTTVTRDRGEFDRTFPDRYSGEVTLTLTDGSQLRARRDTARGYPDAALSDDALHDKFRMLVGEVRTDTGAWALEDAAWSLAEASTVTGLTTCLAEKPTPPNGQQ